MPNNNAVTDMLDYLAGAAGLTMLDIAIRLQVTESAVYRWSTGEREPQRRNGRALKTLYNRVRGKIEGGKDGTQ